MKRKQSNEQYIIQLEEKIKQLEETKLFLIQIIEDR